ncbi:MAG: GNAT family N-acetyltransferase [Alphaproteobacteria bacterium]
MYEQEWNGFTVSDARDRLDMDVIHGFLKTAYWSVGVPRETVERAIANSHPFGLYAGPAAEHGPQIGFARVVTDYTSFGWLCDVFVLEEWRGRGLATFLNRCVLEHPELQGFRRWLLATRDAHALYRGVGYEAPTEPGRFMTIHNPDIYRR